MKQYSNLFLDVSDDELYGMFKEYQNFNKSGWVSPSERLDYYRKEYVELFPNALTILERDYLFACAVRWILSRA